MKNLQIKLGKMKTFLTFSIDIHGAQIKINNAKYLKFEKEKAFVLANHLISIRAIIDQTAYHISLSSKNFSEDLIQKILKPSDKKDLDNLIDWHRERSVNAAIVFDNALLDYINILVMLLYSDLDDLRKFGPKQKVEKKMEKEELDRRDWYFALFSVMSREESYKRWFNAIGKKRIPKNILTKYGKLSEDHEKFRKKYQANALKHFGATAFRKTQEGNVISSSYCNIPIEAFYSKQANWSMPIGERGNMIDPETARIEIIDDFKRKQEFILLLTNQISKIHE